MPWVCLQFMIVVFPDHTHLPFLTLNVLRQVSFGQPKRMLNLEGKKVFTILCYFILVYLKCVLDLINVILRTIMSMVGHDNGILSFYHCIFPDWCCIET